MTPQLADTQALVWPAPSIVATTGKSPSLDRGKRHYALVFAYQDRFARPQHTHSFATFTEAVADPSCDAWLIESHTISWLPADFYATYRLGWFPRPGRNYDLADTLRFAEHLGHPVVHWGPFEIDGWLYDRVLDQTTFLESGQVDYQLAEPFRRIRAFRHEPGGALDCIHAVSDVNGFARTLLLRGNSASQFLVEHLSEHFKSRQTHGWVYRAVLAGAKASRSEV